MASQFREIAAVQDQKHKVELYKESLCAIMAAGDVAACKEFIDLMLSDDTPMVISRQMLQVLAQELPKLSVEAHKDIAEYALDKTQPRAVSYDESVTMIREQLAAVLEAEEEWSKAASILSGIDLDSGPRQLDNEYKLKLNVRIAMLYLEDDDSVNAEMFIKKASSLVSACKNEELELQYKSCYARILDSKRRFLEASTRYYELSQVGERQIGTSTVGAEVLQEALTMAVTCCILAAAGPQRSRVLANLYKDERCAGLPVFPFLEKVYLEHILRPEDVAAFSDGLQEHQKAVTSDGSRVWERAVMEHNLVATSRLYNNIYFEELGQLLGVAPDKAESIAARMVMESRLKGSIDQVEGLLSFTTGTGDLVQWDQQIESVCHRLDEILQQQPTKPKAVASVGA